MDTRYGMLKDVGIDIVELTDNMGFDDKMIEYVFKAFLKDDNFEKLCKSIECKDYETAFLAAHTLKGVLSNLAIKNLQLLCSNIVEKLRHKDYDNIDCEFKEFCNMYNEIRDTIMEVYDE